ncbi:helix-turn-helix transcriptional regulator [uncultured Methylobacterium sp.]|uniref:helix-turn-helix transcriptional regulator n=1 Tax=uncultured Methylobacterium sp. TaxID=157278 RepID=UPI0035CC7423
MTIVRTKTPAGEAIVILPEAEFERLRELAEDALDERIIDASQDRLRSGTEELLTEADLDALRAAPSPLAFWRARRGTSIDALARDCAVSETTIAALERGEDIADPGLHARLARALGIDIDDIVPDAV